MSTVLSGSAQPGAAAGLYSHSSQPYIQRLGIAGVSIQRLQAVPTPCRPLERAVPVPCQRAGIAAQARARGRAVLGTGTGEAGRAVFVPGQISIVPVLARWAWPVWKSLAQSPGPRCHRTPTARRARRHPQVWARWRSRAGAGAAPDDQQVVPDPRTCAEGAPVPVRGVREGLRVLPGARRPQVQPPQAGHAGAVRRYSCHTGVRG